MILYKLQIILGDVEAHQEHDCQISAGSAAKSRLFMHRGVTQELHQQAPKPGQPPNDDDDVQR